jgi:uncharacterized protein YgiB involved in biofilm formation
MKRSKKLQLALIGATPLVLAGCGQSSKEALVYKDAQSCTSDGVVSEEVCSYEYNRALQSHLSTAPRYQRASDCATDFGQTCQRTSSGEYIPTMQGFMLSPNQQSSNRSSFTIIPLYLGGGGYYRTGNYDRIGSSYKQGKVTVSKSSTAKPTLKSTTMKRGGFGSRSAARGSWGG